MVRSEKIGLMFNGIYLLEICVCLYSCRAYKHGVFMLFFLTWVQIFLNIILLSLRRRSRVVSKKRRLKKRGDDNDVFLIHLFGRPSFFINFQ